MKKNGQGFLNWVENILINIFKKLKNFTEDKLREAHLETS